MTKKNLALTKEQVSVLFKEETERPGSSELNKEKREGSYHLSLIHISEPTRPY